MNIDDLFKEQPIELPTMTKDEYIEKAKEFMAKIHQIYWTNWGMRPLNDDEYPSELQCEKCDNHCMITIKDVDYDCYPDREYGSCFIRLFDDGNYVEEMSEFIGECDGMELLEDINFTDPTVTA